MSVAFTSGESQNEMKLYKDNNSHDPTVLMSVVLTSSGRNDLLCILMKLNLNMAAVAQQVEQVG